VSSASLSPRRCRPHVGRVNRGLGQQQRGGETAPIGALAPRYHRATRDNTDVDAPAFDPPDADVVYARYLDTCRRLGVQPVPRDRARGLIAEWSDAIASGQSVLPATH
jgi:hypothetical protein